MFGKIQQYLFGTVRRKLTVGLMLILATTIALLIWDVTTRQQSTEFKNQGKQLEALAETVATSSAVWLGARDYSGLQNIVTEISQYPELKYVMVLDLEGKVLAHSDTKRRGQYVHNLPSHADHMTLKYNENLLQITHPIMLANTQIGWVLTGLDRTKFNAEISSLRRNGLFYAILSMMFGFFLATMTGRYLTQRLHKIQSVIDAVQAGTTDKRVHLNGNDEAAQLANQFNNMLDVLAQREEDLNGTFNQAAVGIAHVGLDGSWLRVNQKLCSIVGYSEDELLKLSFQDITHPDDLKADLEYVSQMLAGSIKTYQLEKRYLHKSSEIVWINLTVSLVCNKDGSPKYFISVVEDISARKQVDLSLRIAATAFQSHEGMMVTDANATIVSVNRAFTNITGYTDIEVIGKNPRIISAGRHDKVFYIAMWNEIINKGTWDGEVWNKRKNGEIYPEHLTITAVKDEQDNITHYVGTFADITLSKAAADKIQNLAFYDSLTQLPNRRQLLERLEHALSVCMRNGEHGALLFLDLDHFKTLNDTLGHEMGDILLRQVAERLTTSVRDTDTVARLGGDEFVVLLEGLSSQDVGSAEKVKTMGNKILAVLSEPYQLDNRLYHSSSSIGVTLFGEQTISADELLKQADIAMYQAKSEGRNALRFFDPKMQQAINARAILENDLRNAIKQKQFELYYQIQVDENNQPLGAEALIRWHHPVRGLVYPATFIELAEETGHILAIGQWVLETVCAQLKVWQQAPLTQHLSISLNISAKQFAQRDFAEQVKTIIAHHGINPERLNLELTESLLLQNVEETIDIMNALKIIGIRFELDDFGTGYSSLQYLKKLPLYQLKIDQSFVRDIATDDNDHAIVKTIIAMARGLGLNVIAEGVETVEQMQHLLNKGCMRYQGYLFSKPVPITEFEALLSKREIVSNVG